jgi:hypothetical protein
LCLLDDARSAEITRGMLGSLEAATRSTCGSRGNPMPSCARAAAISAGEQFIAACRYGCRVLDAASPLIHTAGMTGTEKIATTYPEDIRRLDPAARVIRV